MSNEAEARLFGEEAVRDFYEEIIETLQAALPLSPEDIDSKIDLNQSNGIWVLSITAPLFYGRKLVSVEERQESERSDLYALVIEYTLTKDRNAKYLTVKNSGYQIRVHTQSAIKFEYEREKKNVAAAHIHFSGIGGLLSPALMKNGKTKKGDPRKDGDIKALHIPVGGHRFRPSLEDFLYFTILECGFQAKHGWERALKESRETWFDIQLQASIRDNPAVAMGALQRLGFNVTPPKDGCPAPRRHSSW